MDSNESMEEDFAEPLQKANFESKIKNAGELRIVLPGDFIGEGFIAGHGTYENQKDGKIYANMAGVVHQIDQVICVKPLRQGYRPDIGDVVVGRIVQVDQKRWIVDVNSY